MSRRTITVENYNPEWPREFQRLRAVFADQLGELAADIQHIGSTSIPGCAAKPVIDIDIIVNTNEEVNRAIELLAPLGYRHQGDLGILDRQAFDRADENVPYSDGTVWKFDHNMYVCLAGATSLRNHLALRDYLRGNLEAAAEYGRLKKELAAKYPNDIDSYIDGKVDFITRILELTGMDEDSIEEIDSANRKVVEHSREK